MHYFFKYDLIDKRKPTAGVGWLEFVMSKEQKYNLMLALIAQGVLKAEDIKSAISQLEMFLNPVEPKECPICCSSDNQSVQVRLEGILHGKTFLERLANFVYLLEDEKHAQAQKEKH